MTHYDAKRAPKRELAVNDAAREKTVVPSYAEALALAYAKLDPRWMKAAEIKVTHVLLQNLDNGARRVRMPQYEIARSCAYHETYVRRVLRMLEKRWHYIECKRGQTVNTYIISADLLPDYVRDAPQPQRRINGPIFGGSLPFRSDTSVSVAGDTLVSGENRNGFPDETPVSVAADLPESGGTQDIKGTRARELARQLDTEKKVSLPSYLSSGPWAMEQDAVIEAVWRTLRKYDPRVDRKGAQKLTRDFRQNQCGDATSSEICHCIIELGEFEKQNPRIDSLGGFLIAEVPRRYPGCLLTEYREQQKRQLELDLRQEPKVTLCEHERRNVECQVDVEISPARLANRERERHAHAKALADQIRNLAEWLLRCELTKVHAEELQEIADQVEKLEPLRLEDLLASMESEIQDTLLAATAPRELGLVRARALNMNAPFSQVLFNWWGIRELRVPEKLLCPWRKDATHAGC
jgi:hypothetical protein